MAAAVRETISVHPMSNYPNIVWQEIKEKQIFRNIKPISNNSPISSTALRFVCISDTHSLIYKMDDEIPPGDVLIHAGDFTGYGEKKEILDFNRFLGSLPHKHKIVIAGNHEMTFDPDKIKLMNKGPSKFTPNMKCSKRKSLLTNCHYLQDSSIEINGVKIYGSPWQPEFGNWAFNIQRGQPCLNKWNLIPNDVDVLVTHSPPLGRGDFCSSGVRAGCVELLSTVQKRVKPKYHVFGHIHEGYGVSADDQTVFINASTCNSHYDPVNSPIIFDIELREGQVKL